MEIAGHDVSGLVQAWGEEGMVWGTHTPRIQAGVPTPLPCTPPASHHPGFAPAALPIPRPREEMLFRWTDLFPPVPRWKRPGLASRTDAAHVGGESHTSGWTTVALLLPGGNLPLHLGLACLSLTASQLPVRQRGRADHLHRGGPVHLPRPGGQQVPGR